MTRTDSEQRISKDKATTGGERTNEKPCAGTHHMGSYLCAWTVQNNSSIQNSFYDVAIDAGSLKEPSTIFQRRRVAMHRVVALKVYSLYGLVEEPG